MFNENVKDESNNLDLFGFLNGHTDGQIKRDSIFIGLDEIEEEERTIMFPTIVKDFEENSCFLMNNSDQNSAFDDFLTAMESPRPRSRINSLIGMI